MTPKERHALADRLDRSATALALELPAAVHDDVTPMMRAAAAALREMPSTEEVVTAARASLWKQLESEAVERLTAEVARLRAGIDAHRRRVPTEPAAADHDLWALLDTEGDTDE